MDFNNPVIIQCRKYRIFDDASCMLGWVNSYGRILPIHRFIFEQEIIPKETALQKIPEYSFQL